MFRVFVNDRLHGRLTDAAVRSRGDPRRPVCPLWLALFQVLSLPPAPSCRPPPCTPVPQPSACGRCPTRSYLRRRRRWQRLAGCRWCTPPRGYRQTWRRRWAYRPRRRPRRPLRKRRFFFFSPSVWLSYSPSHPFFLVSCLLRVCVCVSGAAVGAAALVGGRCKRPRFLPARVWGPAVALVGGPPA